MPQGPFGLLRLTTVLPFSSDEVEIEYHQSIFDDAVVPPEAERLFDTINVQTHGVTKVNRFVYVKQLYPDTPSDILDRIRKDMAQVGERVATIQYYISGTVGYIARTEIDERIQREGIGSDLRQTALRDMVQKDVNVVYSYPSTEAGRKLAESQGFEEFERDKDYMVKRL